jgi:hypothetical protein
VAGDERLSRRGERRRIPYIQGVDCAGDRQQRGESFERRPAPRDQSERGAPARISARKRGADAARSPGDDNTLGPLLDRSAPLRRAGC